MYQDARYAAFFDPTMGDPKGFASTTIVTDSERVPSHGAHVESVCFVIAWCAAEPDRVGEVAAIVEGGLPMELGRGPGDTPSDQRIHFFRQRPGSMIECHDLLSPGLSRRQLLVIPMPGGARIDRI